MKLNTQNGMKRVNVNVDQMQVFVIINVEIKINAECEELIQEFVIKDLFGILVIVNVNVINHVILVIMKIMETGNIKKIS